MSFLPGMFPYGMMIAAAAPPELSFLQLAESSTAGTTFSFAGQNLGAADPTRRIVVAVHFMDSVTACSFSSATIAGIAATLHLQVNSGGNLGNMALISALVPTGTSGSIVINLTGGTPDRCAIGVYRAIMETVAAPHATASASLSGGVLSATINIPDKGWVIAGVQPIAAGTPTGWAWSGVTERYDGAYPSAAGIFRSGGSQSNLPAQTGRAISATFSAGGQPAQAVMAAMSWG